MPIRSECALALAEMGFAGPLAEDLKAVTEADRRTISSDLAKGLLAKMKGSNPKATTRVQIQAKDALFSIRHLVEPELRAQCDREMVSWIIGDFTKRNQGDHSAEKIIKTIGRVAGDVLASNLTAEGAPVVGIATLLRRVGTQEARDRGARALVELAKKQNPPQVQTFHALGKLGSEVAVDYMNQVAQKGELEHRIWALRAMALYPLPKIIPTAKAIAADETLTDEKAILRDDAFTLLERIQDPASLEALVTFLQNKDEKVRYRAVEAIIAGFRDKGLAQLLEGLSPGYTYKKEDVEDFIEKDIISLGPGTLKPLRALLESKSWIARLVAARVLGKVGTKQDIPALEKLAGDKTKIKGWGAATVGSEAQAAADAIGAR